MNFMLTEKQARLTLEALFTLVDEGCCSLDHYDSGADWDDVINLGRELCKALDISLEGRDWLRP